MDRAELGQLYQSEFDSTFYLDTYLNSAFEIDKYFCTQLFKVFDQGKLKGPRCVDIGAGPLVHRLGYASRICDEVVHTDFTYRNRELVRQWLTTNELDQKYSLFLKYASELEGYKKEEEGAKILEARLKSRLTYILPIDILNEEPIKDLNKYGGPFDCALSLACVESASSSYKQFVQALRNISSILKPGAGFVLTGFLNGSFYKVGKTTFPRLKCDADLVKKGLKEAGFRLDFLDELNNIDFLAERTAIKSDCTSTFFSLAYKDL